jgi:hypothetical protein
MLSLSVPYETYNKASMYDRVYMGIVERPPLLMQWPSAIRELLDRGWSSNFRNRDSMAQLSDTIESECLRLHAETADVSAPFAS